MAIVGLTRINREGCVQKQLDDGSWYTLKAYMSGGRSRAVVKMRSKDNRKIEVPLVWLMADAFMGGRRRDTALFTEMEPSSTASWKT